MDLETEIRRLAAAGHSKQYVMDRLGYNRHSFELALEYMAPIRWPAPGRSNAHQVANQARRGRFTATLARAQAKAAAARRTAFQRTVRGITGSVVELIAHFELAISAATVRRRIAAGKDPEEALFTPPTPNNGLRRNQHHKA